MFNKNLYWLTEWYEIVLIDDGYSHIISAFTVLMELEGLSQKSTTVY